MTEVADLIEQVRDHDPAQAQELFDKTMQGIGNGERRSLEGQIRTKENDPERDGLARIRTLPARLEDGAPEIMLMGAKDDAAHGQKKPSSNTGDVTGQETDTTLIGGAGEDQLHPDAKTRNRELAPPSSHADQIEGTDEQVFKMEDGMKALDEANAAIDTGKQLSGEDADRLKSRMDEAFRFDEDTQLKARAMGDALKSGNLDDIKTLQRDLDALANDPERKKAQQETLDYYRRTTPEVRQQNAEQRGDIRKTMESNVGVLLANSTAIKEQQDMIVRHQRAAETGDVNAKRIVDDARARLGRLEDQGENLTKKINEQSGEYQTIPGHPYPDIDRRGGRQEDATEQARQTRKDLAIDATILAAGGAGAMALKGAVSGVVLTLGVNSASAARTYSRTLREATAQSMRKSGVDFSSQKAVANWARDNPQIAAENSRKALAAAASEYAGDKLGNMADDIVKNPVGNFIADELIKKGVKETLKPE